MRGRTGLLLVIGGLAVTAAGFYDVSQPTRQHDTDIEFEDVDVAQ